MSPSIVQAAVLAERLKTARVARGHSQPELERISGVGHAQISRLERAQVAQPSLNDVLALAAALRIPLEALISPTPDLLLELLDDEAPTDRAGGDQAREQATATITQLLGAGMFPEIPEEWLAARLNVLVIGDRARELAAAVAVAYTPSVLVADAPPSLDGLASITADASAVEAAHAAGSFDDLAVSAITDVDAGAVLPVLERGWRGVWFADPDAVSPQRALEVLALRAAAGSLLEEHVHLIVRADSSGSCDVSQIVRTASGRLQLLELHGTSGLHRLPVAHAANRPPRGLLAEDRDGVIALGTAGGRLIGVHPDDLATHLSLTGVTGSGKSVMLGHLAAGLAQRGHGVLMFDPNGDYTDRVGAALCQHAPERAADLIVLDADDRQHPILFNPLNVRDAAEIEMAVHSVKEALLAALNLDVDGAPRAMHHVEMALWAMCEANLRGLPGHLHLNVLDLQLFFSDADLRAATAAWSKNRSVRSLYGPDGTFEMLGARGQIELVTPVMRTLEMMTTTPAGDTLGQSCDTVKVGEWLRDGKVILVRTPGCHAPAEQTAAKMLTALLLGRLAADLHEPLDRRAFVVVDELQKHAGEALMHLLATGRKLGVSAIVSSQGAQSLPPRVLRAVQSDTQNKIVMCLNAADAADLAAQVAGGAARPQPADLAELGVGEAWANLRCGNRASGPVRFQVLEPLDAPASAHQLVQAAALRSRGDLSRFVGELLDEQDGRADRTRAALAEAIRAEEARSDFGYEPFPQSVIDAALLSARREQEELAQDGAAPAVTLEPSYSETYDSWRILSAELCEHFAMSDNELEKMLRRRLPDRLAAKLYWTSERAVVGVDAKALSTLREFAAAVDAIKSGVRIDPAVEDDKFGEMSSRIRVYARQVSGKAGELVLWEVSTGALGRHLYREGYGTGAKTAELLRAIIAERNWAGVTVSEGPHVVTITAQSLPALQSLFAQVSDKVGMAVLVVEPA